jgi:hypothetical protein
VNTGNFVNVIQNQTACGTTCGGANFYGQGVANISVHDNLAYDLDNSHWVRDDLGTNGNAGLNNLSAIGNGTPFAALPAPDGLLWANNTLISSVAKTVVLAGANSTVVGDTFTHMMAVNNIFVYPVPPGAASVFGIEGPVGTKNEGCDAVNNWLSSSYWARNAFLNMPSAKIHFYTTDAACSSLTNPWTCASWIWNSTCPTAIPINLNYTANPITNDAGFVDPQRGNFRLKSNSILKNAGCTINWGAFTCTHVGDGSDPDLGANISTILSKMSSADKDILFRNSL